MNNFLDEQGNAVADDKLSEMAQSGALRAAPGSRVHMLDSSGRPVTVPAEEVAQAFEAGFSPELSSAVEARHRQKEFGTLGQKAATAAEGAARGLTFGLSDVALTGLGGEGYRQDALARREVNPGTAIGGEVVGALAPLIASGGASAEASLASRAITAVPRAATRVARAALPFAGETRAARMMVRAAQGAMTGALEGALYGAGSAAGQAALKGDEITAEKVLSGAGHGSLIGSLLGAAGGALGGSLERVGAQQGDDLLLRTKLDKLETSLRKKGETEARIATALERETASQARRGGILDRFASSQALEGVKPGPRVINRHARSPADVDALLREAGTDYLNYEIRTGPLQGKRIFHAAASPTDALDDISHAWAETDDVLRGYKQQAAQAIQANPQIRPDTAALSRKIESTLAETLDPRTAREMSRRYLEPLRDTQRRLAFDGVAPSEIEALESTRAMLTDALESAKKPAELKALHSMRRAVDDTIAVSTESALMRSGVDTSAFRQELRTHRSLSLVRDAVEELKLAQYSGKGGMDSSAAGYALAAVLSGNFGGSLAVGATMLGQNFLKNRGSGIVAELAHRVSKADVRMNWGAKALSGDGFRYPVRSALTNILGEQKAERVYSSIAEVASDEQKRVDRAVAATRDIAEQYPSLAAAVQTKLMGDLQYLAEHVPARFNRSDASLTPNAVRNVGNRVDNRDFSERVAALEDPGYVVDELLHGRIPTAAIETLKARRPHIWDQLREQVMIETALRRDELPFRRRLTLGEAFDFPADKSQLPGMLEAIQQSVMPQQQGAPAQPSTADQAMTTQAMMLPSEQIGMPT